MMRHSDTARGRVMPTSKWIVLVLAAMVVLASSESALAETPGGSTATAATQEEGQQQHQQLPVSSSSAPAESPSSSEEEQEQEQEQEQDGAEEEESPVISSLEKLVDPAAAAQDSLGTLKSEGTPAEHEKCSENAVGGHCNSLLTNGDAEGGQWEWAVFKEDASREWSTLSAALDSSHPLLRGLVYAGLCALVGCAGSVVMAVVVGTAFYLAFVRGKKHD